MENVPGQGTSCERPGSSRQQGLLSKARSSLTHFQSPSAVSFCPLRGAPCTFPLTSPREAACRALMKGEREHSACSVVMTCVVEQGQLVSTLGASGSITGAPDPEHGV